MKTSEYWLHILEVSGLIPVGMCSVLTDDLYSSVLCRYISVRHRVKILDTSQEYMCGICKHKQQNVLQ